MTDDRLYKKQNTVYRRGENRTGNTVATAGVAAASQHHTYSNFSQSVVKNIKPSSFDSLVGNFLLSSSPPLQAMTHSSSSSGASVHILSTTN